MHCVPERLLGRLTAVPSNPLFLYYRKACPSFTGSTYSATATYAVDAQIYFTNSAGNGDYYKCLVATSAGQSEIVYTAEGRNTSIAVSQWNDGAYQFHVAGKVEASTEMFDMKLQRMLGHLPGLINKQNVDGLVHLGSRP